MRLVEAERAASLGLTLSHFCRRYEPYLWFAGHWLWTEKRLAMRLIGAFCLTIGLARREVKNSQRIPIDRLRLEECETRKRRTSDFS